MFKDFLAPIYDYTDLPFRLLCQRHGAGAVCVPLVSAAAIANDASKVSLVDAHPDEKDVGVQLVGAEPEWMSTAAKRIADAFPHVSWLNINCGCPSVRTMGCGGGSALLSSPQRIAEIVAKMRKADLPVSVKMRVYEEREKTVALCKRLEGAGADFLIVHGRTVRQGYSGKADWETIKAMKEALGIPIIGNGDIASSEQGHGMVREGYCDSYMIGRAAMSNPMVFSGKEAGPKERFAMLEEYIALCEKHGCDALKNSRIKAVNMLAGVRNASKIRDRAFRAGSVDEIIALKELFV
ncbi:MAG: tRNA-dihydrouridine synthase family protein [Candidatus Micrarchaeota archaeon]